MEEVPYLTVPVEGILVVQLILAELAVTLLTLLEVMETWLVTGVCTGVVTDMVLLFAEGLPAASYALTK